MRNPLDWDVGGSSFVTMDPRTMRHLEFAQTERAQAAGRRLSNKNRLLDNGDQNIGNAVVVTPQPLGPGGIAQSIPLLDPPRILALDAESPTGQMVTITMGASLMTDNGASGASTCGPITGIIEHGNGSVFSRIEFDVPVGPFEYNVKAKQPVSGGVTLTLPCGTLRVYARHDGSYATPTVTGALAAPIPPMATNNPAQVLAFATYFTRPGSQSPRRTLYPGTAFNALANGSYSIPPFAKRFRLVKGIATLNAKAYDVLFLDSLGGNVLGFITYAAGSQLASFTDIPGTANIIFIQGDAGAAAAGQVVAFEFELQA